jgi:hypothetical protein
MIVNVSGQSDSPFSGPNPLRDIACEWFRKLPNPGMVIPAPLTGAELAWP